MIRIANIIKLTGLYTINSSFITLLSIIYFISGFQSLSIEISILHSCIAFFTFSLSSYSKNLIVISFLNVLIEELDLIFLRVSPTFLFLCVFTIYIYIYTF